MNEALTYKRLENIALSRKSIKIKNKNKNELPIETSIISHRTPQHESAYIKELLNYMWKQKDPVPLIVNLRLLGYSYREIAHFTGLSRSAVFKKLKGVRKGIRRMQ